MDSRHLSHAWYGAGTLTRGIGPANIGLMEAEEERATSHEPREAVNILGIETSCDETAAAVVADGRIVKSSVVASQTKLHEKYGGVVPEVASRAHIEKIYPVIAEAIEQAQVTRDEIDAVAVANQPGLTIALVVGVTAAKTLSFAWEKPLIAINHLHAHLQSAMLDEEHLELPAVALIVSGGHTCLYDCESPLELQLLGSTIDDAAGEAFDKVATILRLPYPGGPSIEKAAKDGDPSAVQFPRSMLGPDSLDFSFSGIKTAVLYHCRGQDMKGENRVDSMSRQQIADIAASFQAAIIEVLVKKTLRAAEKIDAKTVLLGGGVAANNALRDAIQQMCDSSVPARKLLVAPKPYCTDNAVMVASLAYYKFKAGLFADLSLEAKAHG
ncbi:MAG: tRNA (adenosine(37)-N6)-threonylcarbamoyltransferase complex transferase subunit TsaD [Phycisphaerales bacterium]|nr:MAG: tRNA (adenosine(37)-N6)-threonylcarbamoyltransferase complex transferase subunit TsaD [Phycisphaerales bacterium]